MANSVHSGVLLLQPYFLGVVQYNQLMLTANINVYL